MAEPGRLGPAKEFDVINVIARGARHNRELQLPLNNYSCNRKITTIAVLIPDLNFCPCTERMELIRSM